MKYILIREELQYGDVEVTLSSANDLGKNDKARTRIISIIRRKICELLAMERQQVRELRNSTTKTDIFGGIKNGTSSR